MACTVEQANEVIDQVAEGRSVRSVCKEKSYSRWSFYALIEQNGELASRLTRAQMIRDEATEDEILEIADEVTDNHNRQRHRLEARYKILAARRPARWGAKLDLQVTNKPDARLAEQRADQRLARYQHNMVASQVIDAVPNILPTLADKQTAGAIDNPPEDNAPSIFS